MGRDLLANRARLSEVVVERWVPKTAYEKYLGWRQETGVRDQLVAACSGPPSIRYYDIADA
ncbi:MAG: hypothetical protein ACKVIN_03820 [Longimicrobiales bacterium]